MFVTNIVFTPIPYLIKNRFKPGILQPFYILADETGALITDETGLLLTVRS